MEDTVPYSFPGSYSSPGSLSAAKSRTFEPLNRHFVHYDDLLITEVNPLSHVQEC